METKGPLIFSAHFDSGNLLDFRRVTEGFNYGEYSLTLAPSDFEYEVWPQPDCFNTPKENHFRSWFYFKVSGLRPQQTLAIRVVAMNNQRTLFVQGYKPVYSLNNQKYWKRVSKCTYIKSKGNFSIIFQYTHRPATVTPGTNEENVNTMKAPQSTSTMKTKKEQGTQSPPLSTSPVKTKKEQGTKSPISTSTMKTKKEQGTKSPPSTSPVKTKKEQEAKSRLIKPPKKNKKSFLGTTPENEVSQAIIVNETSSSSTENVVYFAFSYPFSLHDIITELLTLEKRYLSPLSGLQKELFFKKELLCTTNDGNPCHFLTLSSYSGLQNCLLENITGLSIPPQPIFLNKPIVFISARIHPAETCSSHVFNGILNFLLNLRDPRASILRDKFVFILIPCLNPDGVKRGHFRTDVNGRNLNRAYSEPSPLTTPTIHAVRLMFDYLCAPLSQRIDNFSQSIDYSACSTDSMTIQYYFDLHGHVTKKGCFFIGNYLDDPKKQLENIVFCKLFSLNSPHFDFNACNFSASNVNPKGKGKSLRGISKEGSGRVALGARNNVLHTYILECNFNSGKEALPRPEAENTLPNIISPRDHNCSCFPYTRSTYSNVGRAFLITLLDFIRCNHYSRIANSSFHSHASLVSWAKAYLKDNKRKLFKSPKN